MNPTRCSMLTPHGHVTLTPEEVACIANMSIVDDDNKTNDAICAYHKEARYIAVSAADGAEAIALLADHRIELAVLDIMLPAVCGLSILRSIRKTSEVGAHADCARR